MGQHLYRILTDEWQGDWRRKKTHIQKLQRQPQCWSLTSIFSHSGVLFFLLLPMIVPIPILIPPSYTSIPFCSPYPSLPPPVFLTSAGTLSPTALSPVLFFSHSTADHAFHFPLILCFCSLFCPLIVFLLLNPRPPFLNKIFKKGSRLFLA